MTTLMILTQRRKKLPQRRLEEKRDGRVQDLHEDHAEALQQVGAAAKQECLVSVVFPDNPPTVEAKRKQAARVARRLKKRLDAGIEKVQEAKTNEDVTGIKEQGDSARKGVRDHWQAQMRRKLAPY